MPVRALTPRVAASLLKVRIEPVEPTGYGEKVFSGTVVETNKNALQLYKRFRFVEEGLLIKDRIHKDGKYYNTVIMGRLKP